nr:Dynein light chain 1, cytoplasmic [Polyrhizophydium stewartii]
MSDRKAVIKNADMSEEMQQDAVDCATQAMEKYNIEKDIAAFIKREFDKKYNPTWHCIVGRNFGSYVTHETKHFIYFYLGQIAILLFKVRSTPAACADGPAADCRRPRSLTPPASPISALPIVRAVGLSCAPAWTPLRRTPRLSPALLSPAIRGCTRLPPRHARAQNQPRRNLHIRVRLALLPRTPVSAWPFACLGQPISVNPS